MPATSPIRLGVGVLGYAGVAKAHLNALKKLPYVFWPSPVRFRLLGIGGRMHAAVEDAPLCLRALMVRFSG